MQYSENDARQLGFKLFNEFQDSAIFGIVRDLASARFLEDLETCCLQLYKHLGSMSYASHAVFICINIHY